MRSLFAHPVARALQCFLCALCLLGVLASRSEAGGGPETTLVVVNADSPASLRVANHYVKLRGIPATHICPLRGIPNLLVIDVDTFRERIWKPIEEYLEKHGLAGSIDIIAYSVDFPFGVNYDADFKGVSLPQGAQKFRIGSLTGMTYLIQQVKEKSREYLDLRTNQYFREGDQDDCPSHGFRHRYGWTQGEGKPDRKPEDPEVADRYYLSTMLGFTGMQGNTVPEVLRCLDRAAASDGTHPKGTVYLMANKNVRATTRMNQFEQVIEALKERGRKAVVLTAGEDGQDGKVPIGKKDIIGCMAGIAGFTWPGEKSVMLPGAIAEHLTSFGAKFDGSGQTKISEFLRNGAIGSSGAVAEPYALWPKFPRARLHVYYADGCSLAESFYQSVYGPYQLLILGDPLARPYAHFCEVALVETPKGAWSGTVGLNLDVDLPEERDVNTLEIWIDGRLVQEQTLDQMIDIDTTKLADGEHELRLVVVEDSAIETRSSTTRRFTVKNGSVAVSIKGPKKGAAYGEVAKLSGKASKAKEVLVLAGTRVVATAKRTGSGWKAEVDTRLLGVGTVTLQARATFKDGTVVLSPFHDLEIGESKGAPKKKKRRTTRRKKTKASKSTGGKQAGLRAVVTDAAGKEHTFPVPIVGRKGKQRFITELRKKVQGKLKTIRLEGEIEAPEDGAYRLAMNAAGALTVKVKGETVFEGEGLAEDRQVYAGFALKAGWHRIELTYAPTGTGDLSLWLGGAVVSGPLMGKALRH